MKKDKLFVFIVIFIGIFYHFCESVIVQVPDLRQGVSIKINPPVNLSYKTKKEIYDIRKSYAAGSIFASNNYSPSETVFGQIEDNKPWIDINNTCLGTNSKTNVTGPSEEARFIANPALLVGIDATEYVSTSEGKWCDKHENFMLKRLQPGKLTFLKDKNRIAVNYNVLPFDKFRYHLKGINARDFGYNYIYMDLKQSKIYDDITFDQENNVTNGVRQLKDYLHTESSCKLEGGCNNASYSPELSFRVNKKRQLSDMWLSGSRRGHRMPKRTYILFLKLWKNKPQSPDDEADMTELIAFRR